MLEEPTYDLFFSYAESDREWAEGYLRDALQDAGFRCHSESAFALGVPRLLEFERAVTQSRRILLILSPAYLADGYNQFVSLLAATYGLETSTWPVVPLILRPVKLDGYLGTLTAIDAVDPVRWAAVLERLGAELHRPVPGPPPIPACPYPGMVPYRPEDARFFYGREAEIEQILSRLHHDRLLFVIGPSGSGKSSLVFAGVLPRLVKDTYFPANHWLVRSFRPGQQPVLTLAGLIGGNLSQPATAVADLFTAHPPGQRLLLVVDQFEEVFTQVGRSEQDDFVAALQSLARTDLCTLLVTMRADFYPDLMNSQFWPIDASQRFEIAPLRGTALRLAIEQPAAAVGVLLDRVLVERLIADGADEPGRLPLMQETMKALWGRLERRFLPASAYEHLGGDGRSALAAAITVKADSTLNDLTPAQQQIARQILLGLVQLGAGGRDTRRQQSVAELRRVSPHPADFTYVLEHLTANRLLTRSGDDETGGPFVDLAHEALITDWPQFKRWLAEDRADLLVRHRLIQVTRDWREHQREPSLLYGGSRLSEAQRYAATHPGDLGQDERDFVAASVATEAARERSRYLGQAAGGALGSALGYGIAFALGFFFSRSGLEARLGTLLTFLFMFPIGQLIGFSIGIGLWLWRTNPTHRLIATGLLGAGTSSITYALFLLLAMQVQIDLRHVLAGALLGAGLGLGAGLTNVRRRLIGTALGGTIAAVLALAVDGISWSFPITIISGLLLGTLVGLGFHVTAVDDRAGLLAEKVLP